MPIVRSSRLPPLAAPPQLKEHHVRVPDELARILGAHVPHASGIRGAGVRVAVIDSGFYPHPFYLESNYQIEWVGTHHDPDPQIDHYGHGTAQLACLLAIAPEAHVIAIKCTEVDPSAAIRQAFELGAQVISCAWGFDIDYHPQTPIKQTRASSRKKPILPADFRRLHRLIQTVIQSGVCLVAAAGNGQRAFPSCMPEVISAGGAYFGADKKFHPSDLSTVYESAIFPGRRVPDLCGLAGKRPHGRLLLLPVPPEARIAKRPAFRLNFASDQERRTSRGWALFSGTSAATAMVSGASAICLQRQPGLTPDELRRLLIKDSRPLKSQVEGQPDSAVLDLSRW